MNVTEDGTVYMNNDVIDEPYPSKKAFGEHSALLPCRDPDYENYVMDDHRSVSIDTRNTAVGFTADGQIAGKPYFASCR